jgi:hypothetical protein
MPLKKRSGSSRFTQHVNLKALLVVALFVISQATGLIHLFEHRADGDNDHCEICSVAAHFGNAALPDFIEQSSPAQMVQIRYNETCQHLHTTTPVAYTSRAPPVVE